GKPIVEKVIFAPEFTEKIYFVYLDKKQSSKASIASYYNNKNKDLADDIVENNKITSAVFNAKTLKEFALALERHEAEMSSILEMQTVKESLFSDFNGVVKSLGAWGGDFVLVVSEENPSDYFEEKGFRIILPYKEMIL
ncbi:MAG: hypothetical protein JHC39_06785, partial [Lentimicrobium sp.]|nr:hypothetical protein [Lentimicrobium sp.]